MDCDITTLADAHAVVSFGPSISANKYWLISIANNYCNETKLGLSVKAQKLLCVVSAYLPVRGFRRLGSGRRTLALVQIWKLHHQCDLRTMTCGPRSQKVPVISDRFPSSSLFPAGSAPVSHHSRLSARASEVITMYCLKCKSIKTVGYN